MTVYLVPKRSYHPGMDDGLPHPSEALTLSEIRDQQGRVIELLEQGGAVKGYSDDHDHQLGVLTRQQPLLDEASLAALSDTGHLPSIAGLLAMDNRGEFP